MPDVLWRVSEEQAGHVLRVLGREPHDSVAALILSLRMQWARQQQQRTAAQAEADKAQAGGEIEEAMGA